MTLALALACAQPVFAQSSGSAPPAGMQPGQPTPPPPDEAPDDHLAPPPPAQPAPVVAPTVKLTEARSRTWPLTIEAQVLIGGEMAQPRGVPIAFGAGAELLWKARVGGFAMLLASAGSPILATQENGVVQPSLGDRVSVPFGLAARPLSPIAQRRHDYWGRVLNGIDLQVGLAVENVRTSLDNATVAGLHLGLGVELPIVGGPVEGGLALRLFGRFMVTPTVQLPETPDRNMERVWEPVAMGQIYGGLCYYP